MHETCFHPPRLVIADQDVGQKGGGHPRMNGEHYTLSHNVEFQTQTFLDRFSGHTQGQIPNQTRKEGRKRGKMYMLVPNGGGNGGSQTGEVEEWELLM